MRRAIAIAACLTVLVFAGSQTALARGPHHGGGPAAWSRLPAVTVTKASGSTATTAPRLGPACGLRPRVAAYPVYPVPAYPVVPDLSAVGLRTRRPQLLVLVPAIGAECD